MPFDSEHNADCARVSRLDIYNQDHRKLVALNLRAKLIGNGHTPEIIQTHDWSLDRYVRCTTCGFHVHLHGSIVAGPILYRTCEEAQRDLPKADFIPKEFGQRANHDEFADDPDNGRYGDYSNG